MEGVRVILEAVNENNLELAQRAVDAEVRKNPQSDVYLSLKVFVASRSNDRRQALETAERAVTVCSKKTLEMFLMPVLIDYNASDLLNNGFVRINRQNPTDHQVCEEWLESSLALGNLGFAQKALMAMQRSSKKLRAVCFQLCYIMALDNSNPKLFSALADRMIQKYLPASTPQECYVVSLVYKMTSYEKVVAYLQSSDIFDSFVSGSLELQLLLLDALINTKKWEELKNYSIKQLKSIDSFNYWQALNTAAVELGTPEVASNMTSDFTSSNSMLAAVYLANTLNDKQKMSNAILDYWKALGAKPSTYKYLKPFVNSETVRLLEENSKSSNRSLGMKINISKFKSLIGEPLSVDALLSIYQEHLQEAPAEKSDYFIGTDAVLMAANGLLRSEKPYSRIQAAVILEYALISDPHQFYVRLLLIRIYQSLGTIRLAHNHFMSLSIKNIQLTTLGYLLSTRMGSVAPELTKTVLPKLTRAYSEAPNAGVFSLAGLYEGTFTQFAGIFELEQKLRLSLDRALLVIERVRASRCTRGTIQYEEVDAIIEPANSLVDLRDFAVTNFDDGNSSGLPSISAGPIPSHDYLRIQKLKEMACHYKTQAAKIPEVESLGAQADASSELTQIEKWNVRSVQAMVTQGKQAKIETPPAYEKSRELDWELFHWCYTVLETTKLAKSFKCTLEFDSLKLIKELASIYQSELNVWEAKANESLRESKLPGEASKTIRLVKQEHMDKLKQLLEITG